MLSQVTARFLDLCGESDESRRVVDRIRLGVGRFGSGPTGGDGRPGGHGWAAGVLAAAELLGALILERDWRDDELREVLEPLVRGAAIELDQLVTLVFVTATRALSSTALPPARGIEAEVRLLRLCAPVRGAAVVTWSPPDRADSIAEAGLDGSSAAVHAAVRRVLDEPAASEGPDPGAVLAIPVGGGGWLDAGGRSTAGLRAALVVDPIEPGVERAIALAAECAAAVATLFERAAIVSAAAEAADERSRQLRDQLHDGPLQSLALLSGEIQLLRSQLRETAHADAPRLLEGRLEDILSLATSVQRDLRELTDPRSPPTGSADADPEGPGGEGARASA